MGMKRRAFSLVELLIATALGLIILALVGYSLAACSRAMSETQAHVEIHDRGRAIEQSLIRDFENMHPGVYVWYHQDSPPPAPPPPRPRLVYFLTTLSSLDTDYDGTQNSPGDEPEDLAAVRYEWTDDNRLIRSVNYTADANNYPPAAGDWKETVMDRDIIAFTVGVSDTAHTGPTWLDTSDSDSYLNPHPANMYFDFTLRDQTSGMERDFSVIVSLPRQ